MPDYPKQVAISLKLLINIEDQEKDNYVFSDPTAEQPEPPAPSDLQLGLIADIFDIFSFHTDLDIIEINGRTFNEITKIMRG